MRVVPLEKLKAEIARPEVHASLTPLLMFRGQLTRHRAHALWNFARAMHLSEAESITDGGKLYNEYLGHFCGVHAKTMSYHSLRQFFNRLRLCGTVTDMAPEFSEYVKHVMPYSIPLVPVPIESERCDHAEWRRQRPLKKRGRPRTDPQPKPVRLFRLPEEKAADLFYPFISGVPSMDHDLLLTVHAAVPKGISHTIRGDLCQDLLRDVLAGELRVENIPNVLPNYIMEARKFMPRAEDIDLEWAAAASQRALESLYSEEEEDEGDYVVEINVYERGKSMLPSDWLEQIKKEYPKRWGDQGWVHVRSLVPRALTLGATWEKILAGTRAYNRYCIERNIVGTEFVKQARTFYGPQQLWAEDYTAPPKPAGKKTFDERIAALREAKP